MKSILKIIIFAVLFLLGYNLLRDENKDVKALEYELTTTSIQKVVENPLKYSETTVSGKVNKSINILGIAYYTLQDSDNPNYEIWIKPKNGTAPTENSLQKVSGTVKQKLKIAGIEVVCLEER
ncbi:hypothetical protein OS188_07375 [Xanthomarina sp. F1114]|uniref:hypothetical protein n=1 Tax=Xanthomarina sp. F1114 TaxID=2996019 RepID=UPI00225DE748|nr:hypothetical protein [Xanthomarina sp. F1114]MCX7547768.1 hypothetical protein [Xanthomarina sp. F1114]